MAGFCETLADALSLNGTAVIPASLNGTANSGVIDMGRFNRVMFVMSSGAAGGNVNSYLQQGNNANGSDMANIANAAASTVNSANQTWTLEIAANQLQYRYVRCQMTTLAATIVTCIPLGAQPRYGPANSYDGSQVNQRFVTATNANGSYT